MFNIPVYLEDLKLRVGLLGRPEAVVASALGAHRAYPTISLDKSGPEDTLGVADVGK